MPGLKSRVKAFFSHFEGSQESSHASSDKLAVTQDRQKALSSADQRSQSRSETSDGDEARDGPTEHGVLEELRSLKIRDFKTLKDVAMVGVSGEPVDDSRYLMERIIQLTAELPPSSDSSRTLTNAFLSQLWNDLGHPAQSSLGVDYAYRKADGSNNNLL